MAGGRPTKYTEKLGDRICEGVSNRLSIAKICAHDDMPAVRTVYTWLRAHKEFLHNYELAKEDQAHNLVEDALNIADDESIDPQHKRIMVDTRKWIASKYNTKKYGDKQQVEHSGTIGLSDVLSDISDDKDGLPSSE
jgi:hypothetical protein